MSNLILLSGGMDSTLCLHKYGAQTAVFFDYGHRSAVQEWDAAQRIAKQYSTEIYRIFIAPLPRSDAIVFGRNAVMLSIAAAYSQKMQIDTIMIGCNASDAERFPDCRTDFIIGMNAAFQAAYGVSVIAPLITYTKKEIVAMAAKELIPATWTCYTPTADGKECGKCYACKVMQEAGAPC